MVYTFSNLFKDIIYVYHMYMYWMIEEKNTMFMLQKLLRENNYLLN